MKAKKVMAVLLASVMTLGMLAGCGSKDAETETPAAATTAKETEAAAEADAAESTASELAGVEITFLNSKAEVQTAIEDMELHLKMNQES